MFRYSVLKTDLLSTREFVGLDHFVTMLTDAKLHKAMLNTVWFYGHVYSAVGGGLARGCRAG